MIEIEIEEIEDGSCDPDNALLGMVWDPNCRIRYSICVQNLIFSIERLDILRYRVALVSATFTEHRFVTDEHGQTDIGPYHTPCEFVWRKYAYFQDNQIPL